MAEVDFERRLERLFAEAPETGDADIFAQRVEKRLARGWTMRNWLIGAAGVAGGLIGASQLFMSDVVQQLGQAEGSMKILSAGLRQAAPRADWMAVVSNGGAGLWLAAGLAVVSMGFVLSRVIDEF